MANLDHLEQLKAAADPARIAVALGHPREREHGNRTEGIVL